MPKFRNTGGSHHRREPSKEKGEEGKIVDVEYKRGDIIDMPQEEADRFENKFVPLVTQAAVDAADAEDETPETPAAPAPAAPAVKPALQPRK